jgi:hypothetical protein
LEDLEDKKKEKEEKRKNRKKQNQNEESSSYIEVFDTKVYDNIRKETGNDSKINELFCVENKENNDYDSFASIAKLTEMLKEKDKEINSGEVVPCLPVQVTLFQIDKHGDQLSVSGQKVMQSEEKLTKRNINIIVSDERDRKGANIKKGKIKK